MTQRSYGQFCGVSKALDLLGERWTLLVVRDLILGPLRFTDLMSGLPGISTDLLADRTQKLAEAGVVVQRRLPPPAASTVYELTARGRELADVLSALGRWGATLLEHGPKSGEVVDLRWALLSLAASYAVPSAHAARGSRAAEEETIELAVAENTYSVRLANGRADVRRGASERPTVRVRAEAKPLFAVLLKWMPLDVAVERGALDVSGDADALRRFIERTHLVVEPAGGTRRRT